jgi:Glucosidase II beta subunit-like protein.
MPSVLQGKCLQQKHYWWTYEVCLGVNARQYHEDDKGVQV